MVKIYRDIYLLDQVSHILQASDDLDDLNIFHIQQLIDLLQLCVTSSIDFIDDKYNLPVHLEEDLHVLQHGQLFLERQDVVQVFLVTPRSPLALEINRVSDIVDIGIILESFDGIRYLPDSLDAAYENILIAGKDFFDITGIVFCENDLFVPLCCTLSHRSLIPPCLSRTVVITICKRN